MVEYFRPAEGLEAKRAIPVKSMVPLDSMQKMNLQANLNATTPLGDLLMGRPSSVAPAQGYKTVRPPSRQELNILSDQWFLRKQPIEKKPPEDVEVKSSNSGSKRLAKRAVPNGYQEEADRVSKLDPNIHQEEHLPTLLGILNSCSEGEQ